MRKGLKPDVYKTYAEAEANVKYVRNSDSFTPAVSTTRHDAKPRSTTHTTSHTINTYTGTCHTHNKTSHHPRHP